MRKAIGCVAVLLAFAPGPLAQGAGDERCQVRPEAVKTWTLSADGRKHEVRPATPGYGGDTGLFNLPSAYSLPQGRFSLSLFRNNLDRDPKDEDISVHGLTFAYGVTSRLELYGSVGLQNRIDADALSQPGFANDYPRVFTSWQTGFGDVWLGVKLKLLDDYEGQPVGLAVRGFVKVPTADEAKGLGTGKLSGGGDLVLSKSLGRIADLHAAVGYQANADPGAFEGSGGLVRLDVANAFRWGVGLNLPACRIFQLQAELTGATYRDSELGQTSPVDLVVGPVVWIKPGIFVRPAISWNLNFNSRGLSSSTTSYTGRQIAVGYHSGTKCCAVYAPPPPPPPPPANRTPSAICQADKSRLLAGEAARCHATASDPDGDHLNYEWMASAGRIAGKGSEATFDTAGVSAPATVSVTVRVTDGRGGSAEAVCPIEVTAPETPKPQPVTCTFSGFPRNLSRLNNVDKACLDDVAARLKQDPGSRVLVVGHADPGERHPELTARKRAEAAKSYLVSERGIDEARVMARSAGANRPLGPGGSSLARARNRRVEVILVPAGATVPETGS